MSRVRCKHTPVTRCQVQVDKGAQTRAMYQFFLYHLGDILLNSIETLNLRSTMAKEAKPPGLGRALMERGGIVQWRREAAWAARPSHGLPCRQHCRAIEASREEHTEGTPCMNHTKGGKGDSLLPHQRRRRERKRKRIFLPTENTLHTCTAITDAFRQMSHLGRHFRLLDRVHLDFHGPRSVLEVDEALQLRVRLFGRHLGKNIRIEGNTAIPSMC